ncbi:MAG: sensor histidine kinase [Bacillota bacterium]
MTILGFVELVAGKIEKTILPNINLEDKKIRKAAETIKRDLNIILSEGDRLTTLVDNLLNISKIESGRVNQKREILDIPAVIEQALLIGRPMIEEAGLGIHMDIADDLPKISGDKDMLTQVFINLISNAVKSTSEGHIKISAKNSGGAILVAIEDTGVGIPEDQLQRIFERYYKLEPSLVKNHKNAHLGLGLYICKQIIEQHGGTIWAESSLDKGSVFYFTIPHLQDKQPL